MNTKRFWSIAAMTAVVALVPTAGAQARVSANANPATYTDTTGDNGSALDVTSVVVSNDATNRITLRINVASLTVPSDNRVLVAIDSDQNRSTGSNGIDYALIGDLSDNTFGVFKWNGSTFVDAQAASATASHDAGGMTFSISSSELGNTTAFDFLVRAVNGHTVAAGNHDDAPDAGMWSYQLGPPTSLALSLQAAVAGKAKAGKLYVAVITVARSDGSLPNVTLQDVNCSATIGSRALKGGFAVAIGPAVGCSWRLPKNSRGKTLQATVTVNLDGATVSKTFTAKIK